MASGYEVRCSVIVLRQHAVLLVHRVRHGLDDWVLPGGTPDEGESLTACARRELLEETGLSANLSQVALVVESVQPAGIDLHPALAGHLYRLLDPGPHGQVPFVGNFWRQA